ncbi:unnamed protein product [Ceratitis capitata]|uniref:(Mediterranean fruit fly) hypothetical protein n=1 Tax=Ceratitis capitata TaxID=7213 RepID=A0A811VFQ6_CERCA|nr:unnamed protein product [Ceratitis capitata]
MLQPTVVRIGKATAKQTLASGNDRQLPQSMFLSHDIYATVIAIAAAAVAAAIASLTALQLLAVQQFSPQYRSTVPPGRRTCIHFCSEIFENCPNCSL